MEAEVPERTEQDWRPEARLAVARLGSGVWAGFLCGAVIGGLGGRLAMFVLRLTSDPSLVGRESDDGFIIGRFSADTVFLVGLTALLGLIGGLFYLMIRGWFPERVRPVVVGILSAAVGGALVIRPEGIDFTLLEPLPLAIAMFVAIPALYGVAVSVLTEFLLRSAESRAKRNLILLLLPLLPIVALGPLGILVLIAILGLWFAGWALGQYLPLAAIWRSEPVTWLGRAAVAALTIYATVGLVQDSMEIL